MRRALAVLIILACCGFFLGGRHGGGSTGGGGTTVGVITLNNVSSSATPGSSFPHHAYVPLAPGAVMPGNTITSVDVTEFGIDCVWPAQGGTSLDCPTWPDGSLRGTPVSFWTNQIAANTQKDITWTLTAGSSVNTTTITPAYVVAHSDYAVIAGPGTTGCTAGNNNSYMPTWTNGVGGTGTPTSQMEGFCVSSGGAVTSGIVRFAPPSTATATPENTGCVSWGSYPSGFSNCGGQIWAGLWNHNDGGSAVPSGGYVNSATYTVSLNANHWPTQGDPVTITNGGSGYLIIGSGSMEWHFNTELAKYGSIQPPTCSAELGAGMTTSGTYSAGTVTWGGTITGHIAKGQILTDSLGATAVVTGSSSPFTVSAALTSGAMTARTPVCVDASNPTMTEYFVHSQFLDSSSGTADIWMNVRGTISVWSQGGSPAQIRAVGFVNNATWNPALYTSPPAGFVPSYTFPALDIKNGTAEIRGGSNGDVNYEFLTTRAFSGFWTVDQCLPCATGASGGFDWIGITPNSYSSSTARGYEQVIPGMSKTAKTYFKASHTMLPLDDTVTVSPLVQGTPTAGTTGLWAAPGEWILPYIPSGPDAIDNREIWGEGGDHWFVSANGTTFDYFYMATTQASDHGASWWQTAWINMLGLGVGGTAGSFMGPTGHALNNDPNFSNAAFTDGVQTNSNIFLERGGATAGPGESAGGQIASEQPIGDTSHWPYAVLNVYQMTGDYIILDQMDLDSQNLMMTQLDDTARIITFNSTTYYAMGINVNNVRVLAWGVGPLMMTDTYGYPNNPDTLYWHRVFLQNMHAQNTLGSFIGTITTPAFTATKVADVTPIGAIEGYAPADNGCVGTGCGPGAPGYNYAEQEFMTDYYCEVLLHARMYENSTNSDVNGLSHDICYNNIVMLNALNPAVTATDYAKMMGNSSTGVINTSLDTTTLPTTTGGLQGTGNWFGTGGLNSIFPTNGSSTIAIQPFMSGTGGVQGPPPSGSVLRPDNMNAANAALGGVPIPTPLVIGNNYIWCLLTSPGGYPGVPATGTINPMGTNCASPAPITMTSGDGTQATAFNAGWWFNTTYPPVSGTQSTWWGDDYQNPDGEVAQNWATINWYEAVAGADSNTATAKAHALVAMTPITTTFPVYVTWDAYNSFVYNGP